MQAGGKSDTGERDSMQARRSTRCGLRDPAKTPPVADRTQQRRRRRLWLSECERDILIEIFHSFILVHAWCVSRQTRRYCNYTWCLWRWRLWKRSNREAFSLGLFVKNPRRDPSLRFGRTLAARVLLAHRTRGTRSVHRFATPRRSCLRCVGHISVLADGFGFQTSFPRCLATAWRLTGSTNGGKLAPVRIQHTTDHLEGVPTPCSVRPR